jgi:hypothetical protein
MYKALFIAVLLAAATQSRACDACGCSIGSVGFGMIPLQPAHFVGVGWQHQNFRTEHPPLFKNERTTFSSDEFRRLQVRGRFYFKSKFFTDITVGVADNRVEEFGKITHLRGLTDPEIVVMGRILKRGDEMTNNQLIWYTGVGLRLPIGKTDESSFLTLPNAQPGAGSTTYVVRSFLTARAKQVGVMYNVNYLVPTVNKYDYRFGNELTNQVSLFKRYIRKQWRLVPEIGGRFVYRTKDHLVASQNEVNDLSGVNLLTAYGGTTIFHDSYGVRSFVQFPVVHQINSGLTQPKPFYSIQLLKKI